MKRKSMLAKLSTLLMLLISTFGIFIPNNICRATEVQGESIPENILYTPIIETFPDSGERYGMYGENWEWVKGFEYVATRLNNCNESAFTFTKDDILSVKSSNPDILNLNSKAIGETKDAGAGYIEIKVKETDKYKAFTIRMPFISYPASTLAGISPTNKYTKKGKKVKNTLAFGPNCSRKMSGIIGKNSKSIVEISSDKKFNNIIKKYTLKPKYFNNQKVKIVNNIKDIGLKKNKTYYLRAYSYRKFNNLTIYSEEYYFWKFKIKKNGIVENDIHTKAKDKENWSGSVELNKNPDEKEILKAYGVNYVDFDWLKFCELYQK